MTTCENGAAALAALREDAGRYDAVVTDLTMPGMNGIELTRQLRVLRPDIPIILCTGFSTVEREQEMREAGVTAMVMKPILGKDIARKIRELLDGPPSQQ